MSCTRISALLLLAVASACAKHSGDVGILQPAGTPKFETRSEISSGTGTHSDYEVADFNGDTFLDMAVIGLSGEMRILFGDGTNFTLAQSIQLDGLPIWIAGGDFDEDGDRDLVVVRNTGNSTDIWWNDGLGNFTAGPSLPVGQDALAVVVGDVDGDGHLDVLVSRPVAPEIVAHFGDGTGSFSTATSITLPNGGSAFNLQIGDVTRDGVPDLIVADPVLSRVLVYPGINNNQKANLGAFAYQLDIPGAPRAVSVGDLSGDGLPDMAVSAFEANRFVVVTDIGLEALAGQDGGGVAIPVSFSSFDVLVDASPSVSTIADVTGDGIPDLVACLLGKASMVVVPQTAQGVLGEHIHFDATGLPLRPFVGDFDHNGKNDLFALSGLGDRINLWLSRADGELLGARNYNCGLPTAAWLGGGDFDGDGDNEVVVGSFDSTRVSLMQRRADGALEAVYSVDIGAPVMQIETADFDFDGRMDLLVSVPGGVKLLHNLSSAGNYNLQLMPGLAVTVGSSDLPFGVTAADLDRDGDLDIAVCDYLGGSVHILPGTAVPFVFGQEKVITLAGGPVDVVAADFTGDNVLDLAVSRIGMSDIVVLRNDGNLEFSSFLDVPVGQAPTYLITADFNRDNRADLVVSNGNSGTISVLFATATGFTGQSYPAGSTPTALLAGDLTGDGLPDILVTSLVSGDFRVMVGDGRGSFPELSRFPGTLGASDALLQDMNGDGKADLLIASLVSNRVSLVKNIRE
jgi:adhesin/invasin